MAVIGVAEQMWSKSTLTHSLTGVTRREVVATEGYTVLLDNNKSERDVLDVLNAQGLPNICDSYLGFQYIKCIDRKPVRKGPGYWFVEVTYKGEVGTDGFDRSPVNAPPEIEWGDTETEEPTDVDWNGVPIVTVNREPMEGVAVKLADLTVTINRNFAFFNPHLTHAYRHSVNNDEFLSFPPGVAKLIGFRAKRVQDNGCIPFWNVTATIQFRYPWKTIPLKAWFARVRHEGFYERLGVYFEITGGGGSGAAGYPIINRETGQITDLIIVNPGYGYTGTPTLTFGTTDGQGSGAAGSVTVDPLTGIVTQLNLIDGGSGYNSYIWRAMDNKGSETTKPVLLKVDGRREYNSYNAVWMEWQRYGFLPYQELGLID